MIKNIEFICSGNKDRSPTAQGYAELVLSKNRIYEVKIISSGTQVDIAKKFDEFDELDDLNLREFVLPYIPTASNNGFISEEEAEKIKEGIEIRPIIKRIVGIFLKKSEEYRKKIVEEKSYLAPYLINHSPNQTIVRPQTELILPISKGNLERTIKIYENTNKKPWIELLADISDPFPSDYGMYKNTLERVESAVLNKLKEIYEF
ncbi:MAG: hypothetical protein IB618_02435 [Candidatus Pacearchaeota archaeon]|nr:MAG: hypothetical protein IB618_02435 [Candidatus Pacearchaeota archaeon]